MVAISLNGIHSLGTKGKVESHLKSIWKVSEHTEILDFNQLQKSDKTPSITYKDS